MVEVCLRWTLKDQPNHRHQSKRSRVCLMFCWATLRTFSYPLLFASPRKATLRLGGLGLHKGKGGKDLLLWRRVSF